ncbi:MAG TPA: SDR family oxidoreductase [Candidatus Acidoferrales bacterium]|nr:SDR family oxidoreductase [Candidatus Acidoferrales bacterium]
MRYLVTGGAGFIGSAVVLELVRRGESVVVIDDLSAGKESNLAAVRNRIEFLRAGVTDRDALERACHGADFAIHLAARTSVPRSVQAPLETNTTNVDGTLNLLVAARDARVRRVVYAASSSAYGETPTLPKVETMPAAPISPYGVSKFAGELYAQVFTRVYGLATVALRYFNVFGPRQDPGSPYSGVLARFMLALLDGTEPVIYGDGEQSRDFTYVDNVVDATLRACHAAGASGRVLNIATGRRFTLNQALGLLETITGRHTVARHEPERPGDIRHSQADIRLARELLGYEPSIDFEEGLRRTWQWYRSEYSAAGSRGEGHSATG